MPINIFTYGSLMFPLVWNSVAKGRYQSSTACLQGYRRCALRGEDYPAVIADQTSGIVEGKLYYRVTADDLRRLDDFEGIYYQRHTVTVSVGERPVPAEVYVLKTRYAFIATEEPWDEKAFQRSALPRFLRRHGADDN